MRQLASGRFALAAYGGRLRPGERDPRPDDRNGRRGQSDRPADEQPDPEAGQQAEHGSPAAWAVGHTRLAGTGQPAGARRGRAGRATRTAEAGQHGRERDHPGSAWSAMASIHQSPATPNASPATRQPHPTGVSSRNRHGLPPAPEPIPRATTGSAATSRAVARADASSEVDHSLGLALRPDPGRHPGDGVRETGARVMGDLPGRRDHAQVARPRRGRHPPQRARDVGAQHPGIDHRGEPGPTTGGLGEGVAGWSPGRQLGGQHLAGLEHTRCRGRPSESIASPPPDQSCAHHRQRTCHTDARRRAEGASRRPRPTRRPRRRPRATVATTPWRSTTAPARAAARQQARPGARPRRPSPHPLRQLGGRRPRAIRPSAPNVTAATIDTAPATLRTGTPTWVTCRRPSGARARWMTASRADASWLCAASRGSPAAAASASIRAGTSPAELACRVPQPPACPVLRAASRSTTSAPRTSPTTSRSGRIRSAWRTRVLRVISPAPSMLGGLASSPSDVRVVGPQLARVLDQHQPLARVDQTEQCGQHAWSCRTRSRR